MTDYYDGVVVEVVKVEVEYQIRQWDEQEFDWFNRTTGDVSAELFSSVDDTIKDIQTNGRVIRHE